MFCKILVRNWYENNGSFDGILKLPISSKIREEADKAGLTFVDYCYKCLGYCDKENVLTPSEVFGIYRDLVAVRSVSNKLGLADKKMLNRRLKSLGVTQANMKRIRDCFKVVIKSYDLKVSRLIGLLKAYYVSSVSGYTMQNELIAQVIAQAAIDGKSAEDVLSQYPECQIRFSPIIRGKQRVCNRTLYYTGELSEEEKFTIQVEALNRALGKNCLFPMGFVENIMEIPFGYFGDDSRYVWLIAYAAERGITYADMLESVGICVTDQVLAYDTFGVLLYKVADKVIVITPDDSCYTMGEKFCGKFLSAKPTKRMEAFS